MPTSVTIQLMNREIIVIAHNIRSIHNVGSLLRTAEGLGVNGVWLTGYTPHPGVANDQRLPHVVAKLEKQINKTALGAQITVKWQHEKDVMLVIHDLKKQGFTIAALEQTIEAIPITDFKPPHRMAIILGREVEGIERAVLKMCDIQLEIPMLGRKESFNVVQAAAMALYHCRFY